METRRMWAIVRKTNPVSLEDVAQMAGVTEADAQVFMAMLEEAGYVRAAASGGWRVLRDTGPRPPMLDAVAFVVDGNTGDIHVRPDSLESLNRLKAGLALQERPVAGKDVGREFGRTRIWNEIYRLKEFTRRELYLVLRDSGISERSLDTYLHLLRASGCVTVTSPTVRRVQYVLRPDLGPERPSTPARQSHNQKGESDAQ